MLVQFRVKNYLSFKDEVLFSMEAFSSTKEHKENVFLKKGDEFLKTVKTGDKLEIKSDGTVTILS